MNKIIEQMIKEYEEIKLLNDYEMERIDNENLILDSFIRDLNLIKSKYDSEVNLSIFDVIDDFDKKVSKK